jgi:hypothetical protein
MMPLPPQGTVARWWCAGFALCLVAGIAPVSRAQPVPASTLKAAFVLNFIKFTEWSGADAAAPINVCLPAAEALGDAMAQTMRGRSVNGRRIHVHRVTRGDAVRECQVLFLSERDPRRLAAILETTSQAPVLTVSDVEGSASQGAMIELFEQDGRLRFAINIDSVERSRIEVSSRLLGLAKIVRDAERQ